MGEVSQGGLIGKGEGIAPSRGQFLPANEPFDQDEAALIGRLRNDVFGLERAVPILIDVGVLGQAAANELLRQALAGENANIILIAGGVLQVIGEGEQADQPIVVAGKKDVVVEVNAELVFGAELAGAGLDLQGTIFTIKNYGTITQRCPALVSMSVEQVFNYEGGGCAVHDIGELAEAIIRFDNGTEADCTNINFGGTVRISGLTGSMGAVHVGGQFGAGGPRAQINQTLINLLEVGSGVIGPILVTSNVAGINRILTPAPVNFRAFNLVQARFESTAAPSASNVLEADKFGNIVIDSTGPTGWSVGSPTPGQPMSIGFLGANGGAGVSCADPCNADRWQALGGGSIATAPASSPGGNSVVGRAEVGASSTLTANNGGDDGFVTSLAETGGTIAGGPSGVAPVVLPAGALIHPFASPDIWFALP